MQKDISRRYDIFQLHFCSHILKQPILGFQFCSEFDGKRIQDNYIVLLQKQTMQDDSSITNSARKSKLERSQSVMTDSFRMAASVLQQGSGSSKRALTLTVPNLPIREKDEYKKQPECQVCFMTFGKFGQHHCRICANAICSSCSYSTINKERACDICAYHYSDKEREKFKTDTIRNLTNLCMQALANKMHMEDQMKKVEMEIPKEEDKVFEKRASEERGKRQNERLQQLARDRKNLQMQIESIRNS